MNRISKLKWTGVALLLALTGCYVGPGPGGPDVVVDPGPVWVGGVWGGDHWHGHFDEHRFAARGRASRGWHR